VLERFPESAMRPGALVCRALAENSARDPKTGLSQAAVEEIRRSLREVLTHHADSPHAALAAVGLVRTELEAGGVDAAGALYRDLVAAHQGDEQLLLQVRDDLGPLALRLGGIPQFQATTLDGSAVGRDALEGKVVVLDFWATWCQPCVDGLPTLRRIAERHDGQVEVLGVNMDRADDLSAESLREWVEREKVPGRQLHDGRSWESDVVRAFGVKEIPFTVVVAANGAVLAVNEHGRELERAVREALRN
jgi:thioredoxin-like negative regulator of GroEL